MDRRVLLFFGAVLILSHSVVRAEDVLSLSTGTIAPAAVVQSTVQVHGEYSYEKPKLFTWLKYQVDDQKKFWKFTFSKESLWPLAAVTASTVLLISYDQYLFENSWKLGDKWSISHSGTQKPFIKTTVPGIDYKIRISGPNNLGTALYFLGDGLTHFTIAGSFLTYGWLRDDYRALQTSSQLVEAIIANGFVVQILKHSTGRENPNTLSKKRGRWRFFPNQRKYAKRTNYYDAFPSGHLPTALITTTVIAENYPEYKFIRPLGYTLMTGLAYQMVNNGVHWYSDYPLSIYMGYLFAKIAVDRGRASGPDEKRAGLEIAPLVMGDGGGVQARWKF